MKYCLFYICIIYIIHFSSCQIFTAMHISSISKQTYYRHCREYMQPTIFWLWKFQQDQLLDFLATEEGVILGGDMRADSPGHCAKYGSYTMMELRMNRVIDIQLVQVRNSQISESTLIILLFD